MSLYSGDFLRYHPLEELSPPNLIRRKSHSPKPTRSFSHYLLHRDCSLPLHILHNITHLVQVSGSLIRPPFQCCCCQPELLNPAFLGAQQDVFCRFHVYHAAKALIAPPVTVPLMQVLICHWDFHHLTQSPDLKQPGNLLFQRPMRLGPVNLVTHHMRPWTVWMSDERNSVQPNVPLHTQCMPPYQKSSFFHLIDQH